MVHSIEVFLQPPSPKQSKEYKLPSINTLYSLSLDADEIQRQQLPTVCLTDQQNNHHTTTDASDNRKLNTLEPHPCLTIITSPISNSSSPRISISSPSLSSVSAISPLISPIADGSSLLAPPDMMSFRRCRSVSNNSSPSCSPSYNYRSLSEPPAFDLIPSSPTSATEEDDEIESPKEKGKQPDYLSPNSPINFNNHPLFGPKRKRGRPPNTSRPESQTDNHWTFIKPTVWDVKNKSFDIRNRKHQNDYSHNNNNNTLHAPSSSTTENNVINTFTSTNMDMTLSIPKKKRGRKPKKQLAGNSCFVWKDLTAPRGANKKRMIRLEKLTDNRSLLPATMPIPRYQPPRQE
ncbi:hypothetical protein G6F57_003737 [Rhizopus arrhizus]|uniref:Uncharacterized protein n=1 Tax=Rhizopus oryzae TaxID=64495 RepID=A0A9P7BWZ6_RHIOR|nr:hypothetical protein G6F23_011977 [Rhizopus arrhizus]KAG0753241.1 hypothetical protein G6F24_013108 [Rhizopus arrhizus]KAG0776279.1 hypothetical protein G6F22_012685 [Rhizopus arrhizus]KAG0815073.1 hypothetical protein G6F20_004279 [Rhizopus arrhizus]KAG0817713.1 hypothetical protein G6F19_012761 [Rhizopus arrhizus]